MRHSPVHLHGEKWALWRSSWSSCLCSWLVSASGWWPSTSLVNLTPQLMSKVSVRQMLLKCAIRYHWCSECYHNYYIIIIIFMWMQNWCDLTTARSWYVSILVQDEFPGQCHCSGDLCLFISKKNSTLFSSHSFRAIRLSVTANARRYRTCNEEPGH